MMKFFSVLGFLIKSIFIHVESMEKVWILFAFYISHGWLTDNSSAHFTATSSSCLTSSNLRYNVAGSSLGTKLCVLPETEAFVEFLVIRLGQN